MEEKLLRFSLIGRAIFKVLNDRDFCKSKEVTQSWNYFITNERALQKAYKNRIQDKIQTLDEEINGNGVWKGERKQRFHLAAGRGYLPVCQQIMGNSDYKNPKDRDGYTQLHDAAAYGHLPVCQLIVEHVDDKNPKNYYGRTPLHYAAENGYLSVCHLIIENVYDKNPKDNSGWTPLHLAARNGHLSVCQLIIENVHDKNPKDDSGLTPPKDNSVISKVSCCVIK